jgi:hypothetical protein
MLIIVNGPPRCGKDTLVERLRTSLANAGQTSDYRQVGRPLKEMTHGAFAAIDGCIPPYWDEFDACKEEPHDFFLGQTPRQSYIDFHEKLLKPVYGPTFLANVTARIMASSQADVKIVSGLTGPLDVHVLRTRLECEPTVVEISRDGCSWDNREPLRMNDTLFSNNGTIAEIAEWTNDFVTILAP